MSHRILAATILTAAVSFGASDSAEAGSWGWAGVSYPTTRYVIEVEWWFFDTGSYHWSEVQSFTSYEDALESLAFHEWMLENGYLGSYYGMYWRYIAVDVRLRKVPQQQYLLSW